MKKIKDFITEKQNFLIKNKSVLKDYDHYEYHPKNFGALKEIIIELLKQGETDLNCIDISNIKDMSYLFCNINENITVKNIDISNWDVSNVTIMDYMFAGCYKFNSDLSNWDVSSVHDMMNMFRNCHEFNSDLSKWDISNVIDMSSMFEGCNEFNSDLSNWNVSNVEDMNEMFNKCTTLEKNNKLPKWYTD